MTERTRSKNKRVYHAVDKTGWLPGPWHDEPDKVEWRDAATGSPCLIVRGHLGAWCGYVGVDESHPWHGKAYSHEDVEVAVHGGLTFAGSCMKGAPEERSICHVPLPGESDKVWWFGFDCAHGMDLMPMYKRLHDDGEYRDMAYVRAEVAALALQLQAVASC